MELRGGGHDGTEDTAQQPAGATGAAAGPGVAPAAAVGLTRLRAAIERRHEQQRRALFARRSDGERAVLTGWADEITRNTATLTPKQIKARQQESQRDRYWARRHAGRCVNCGAPVEDGGQCCPPCRHYRNLVSRQSYHRVKGEAA